MLALHPSSTRSAEFIARRVLSLLMHGSNLCSEPFFYYYF
ncbi:hypothetical protein S7335_2957 [Synechococcus sp. PCC 7335]|nr:hypothetical protein S7335_2957 [Synechococcus sp. PCC 7335]